ncbi:MAG: SpoIID/LytB domain-containing protein [Candidatus Omnitrophica bacterium]|nr:SpoIID/LytB domain-containing protein [Candidatus Omnitrophota bacterium]
MRKHNPRGSTPGVAVVLAGLALLVAPAACRAAEQIRVLVLDNVNAVTISTPAPYSIRDADSGKVLVSGTGLNARIWAQKKGINVGGRQSGSGRIVITPREGAVITMNNRAYRGALQLSGRTGDLLVANLIDVEDYIKGIAVREISHYWPPEAIKANAVAFRTYALYRREHASRSDYDVTADVFSQSYGGRAAERYRITEAVDATRGEVLYYGGKILPAFYSSTCGGSTEDASRLWREANIPPLAGRRCDFCKDSPHLRWRSAVAKETIIAKLQKPGRTPNDIKSMAVASRTPSGRALAVRITTDARAFTIAAQELRSLIGPDVVKSTNFAVFPSGKNFIFEGLGWGHGVGLCQWGAYSMAKEGKNYRQILDYYYPGAELRKTSP